MFKKISVAKARSGRKSVGVFAEDLERRNHRGIPQEIRNDFVRGISNPGFKAEVGETAFEGDLLLLGLGSRDHLDTAAARKAGAGLLRSLHRAEVDTIEFVVRGDCDDLPLGEIGRALAEGVALANWRLDGYDGVNARERTRLPRLRIGAQRASVQDGLKDGLRLAEAVNLARMVGETPPNICHPAWIAKQARKLARDTPGLTCKVIDAKKAAELG
ncbi:MAG: M17 family peptidase N-terminal domain-containing protein, partial [Planctomycetota bacterium]|nr:M17 family peptidase N-terminal domain-containing protein [Planctomycetota bacterium]